MPRQTWLIFATAILFSAPVHAQTIKAKGPAAAGVCAGALDLAAGMMANSASPKPAIITNMQNARDFFADMKQFEKTEVTANAQAFVRLMGERTAKATTDAERTQISAEVIDIAKKCFQSVQQYAVAPPGATPQPGTAPVGTVTAQPVQPAQPGTVYTDPAQPGTITVQPQPIQPGTITVQPQPVQPGTITVQ